MKYVEKKECVQSVVTETKEDTLSYVKPNTFTVFVSKGTVMSFLFFFISAFLLMLLDGTALGEAALFFWAVSFAAIFVFAVLFFFNVIAGLGNPEKRSATARMYLWQNIIAPSARTKKRISIVMTLIWILSVIYFIFFDDSVEFKVFGVILLVIIPLFMFRKR